MFFLVCYNGQEGEGFPLLGLGRESWIGAAGAATLKSVAGEETRGLLLREKRASSGARKTE